MVERTVDPVGNWRSTLGGGPRGTFDSHAENQRRSPLRRVDSDWRYCPPRTRNHECRCTLTARRYEIPFFQVEFQTYEDARQGEWTRLPTYRLVNDQPKSASLPP